MLRKLTSLRIPNVLLTTCWISFLLLFRPAEVSVVVSSFQYSKSFIRVRRTRPLHELEPKPFHHSGNGGIIQRSISRLPLSSILHARSSSYIETIRCRNFGGLINANRNKKRHPKETETPQMINGEHNGDGNGNANGDINGDINGSANGMFFASKNIHKIPDVTEVSNADDDNDDSEDVVVHLGEGPSLVAVTGETGSGKSLLVVKVIEFIMGSKAAASMIPSGCDSAEAELGEYFLWLINFPFEISYATVRWILEGCLHARVLGLGWVEVEVISI